MIPKEILQKVRRIQITTSRMVTDVFAGQYHSVFKGKGMEFDEVRHYQPGDDIRSIDWNVTARMGHPFVKKFVEEREMTVMIMIDISLSNRFGSVKCLKSQIIAELCSVLAFSAIQNNDRVGLIIFTDRIEKFVPPRKGVRHVLRVVREALCFSPQGKQTDIAGALQYLNRVMKRRTVTFVISDFFAPDFKKFLSLANKRHDIVAVSVTDPAEKDLPGAGIVKLHDAETGEEFFIDTGNETLRKQYQKECLAREEKNKEIFRSAGVDTINLRTDTAYIPELIKFFKMRERRLMG